MPKKQKLSECKSKEQIDSDFFCILHSIDLQQDNFIPFSKIKGSATKTLIWLQNIKDRLLKNHLIHLIAWQMLVAAFQKVWTVSI